MTPMFVVRLLTAVSLAATCSLVAEDCPKVAAKNLLKEAKSGKLETVRNLIANLEIVPEAKEHQTVIEGQITERLQRLIDSAKSGKDTEVVDGKSDGDCAIVIINEGQRPERWNATLIRYTS